MDLRDGLAQMTARLIFSSLCDKSAISLTECAVAQGKIAMDGDFRSHAARMPHRLRPERLETPKYILLVKSDFKMKIEKIRRAVICAKPSLKSMLPCPCRLKCY